MTDLYWHFLTHGGHMAYDRAGSKVLPGVTYQTVGPIRMCHRGFHMSAWAIHALHYAPSPWVERCYPGVTAIREEDKIVSNERTAIAVFNATKVLYEFSLWCVEQILARFETSPEFAQAVETCHLYLQEQVDVEDARNALLRASAARKEICRDDSPGASRTYVLEVVEEILSNIIWGEAPTKTTRNARVDARGVLGHLAKARIANEHDSAIAAYVLGSKVEDEAREAFDRRANDKLEELLLAAMPEQNWTLGFTQA